MSRNRKKITFRDIKQLYDDGWEILIKRGSHPKRYCGITYYESKEIRVYLPAHNSKKEISHTILHEFYHALEGENGFKKISENKIDVFAKRSLRAEPTLEDLIKETYGVKY